MYGRSHGALKVSRGLGLRFLWVIGQKTFVFRLIYMYIFFLVGGGRKVILKVWGGGRLVLKVHVPGS